MNNIVNACNTYAHNINPKNRTNAIKCIKKFCRLHGLDKQVEKYLLKLFVI